VRLEHPQAELPQVSPLPFSR